MYFIKYVIYTNIYIFAYIYRYVAHTSVQWILIIFSHFMSSNLHETAGRCILSTVLWYYNVLQYSAQGTTPSSSMYISAYKTA